MQHQNRSTIISSQIGRGKNFIFYSDYFLVIKALCLLHELWRQYHTTWRLFI